MTRFSVLISIYKGDNAQYFDRALQSIWDEQNVTPSEIVLVEDGPLSDELHQVVRHWKSRLSEVLQVVTLGKNMGVGAAKHVGVEACSNELIAVMDADDISLPDRFEKQLALFSDSNLDVCGSWVGEFINNEDDLVSFRRTPERHENIVKFAKSRSPINHPTAMYKKSVVLRVGSYTNYRTSEDFDLFVKLIMDGAKLYNIQEPLVNMRIGSGQLSARRGGLKNALFEVKVQRNFYKMGFLNFYEVTRNILIGFLVRMLPNSLMVMVFGLIRKL